MLTFRTVLDCFQGEYIRFIFSLKSYVKDLIEDSNETDLGDLSFGVGRHIFNDAMQDAEDKKYKSIKSDNILYGVKENRIKLDERAYKVVQYLSEHGTYWAD